MKISITFDHALDAGLFSGVVGFIRSDDDARTWHLVHDDGSLGRETIKCYEFELNQISLWRLPVVGGTRRVVLPYRRPVHPHVGHRARGGGRQGSMDWHSRDALQPRRPVPHRETV
jgi:hypothetical protein